MGADGYVSLYEADLFDLLLKELGLELKNISICNIYERQMNNKRIYTVYYGENNNYQKFDGVTEDEEETLDKAKIDTWIIWT